MEINNYYELIAGKLEEWLSTAIEMLPNIAVALFILLVFYVMARYTRRVTGQLLSRITINKSVVGLAQTVMYSLVLGIGVFVALSVLNLDGTVTSLLAGAGIIGLALGFAFQDIAANFISGILLSTRHPFGLGDIIETNDYFGTVLGLTLRNTIILTPMGQIVYIPNKVVYENPFTNYTKNGERRIDLECGISYGEDLEKVRDVTLRAVAAIDHRDKKRNVEFFYKEFGDSSINFVVRFWIDFHVHKDFWAPQSEAIIAIKKAYDENDIMIPFPIRTLDFGIKGGEKLNSMWPDTVSSGDGPEFIKPTLTAERGNEKGQE